MGIDIEYISKKLTVPYVYGRYITAGWLASASKLNTQRSAAVTRTRLKLERVGQGTAKGIYSVRNKVQQSARILDSVLLGSAPQNQQSTGISSSPMVDSHLLCTPKPRRYLVYGIGAESKVALLP